MLTQQQQQQQLQYTNNRDKAAKAKKNAKNRDIVFRLNMNGEKMDFLEKW